MTCSINSTLTASQQQQQPHHIASSLHASVLVSGGSIGREGAMGAIAFRKRARRIVLNVSENTSTDRKLSLIAFVLSAYYVE